MTPRTGIELAGRDPYQLLGLSTTATSADVVAAKRRLLFRKHPDRGGDTEQAALVNAAATLLTDPARRRAYDEHTQRPGRPAPGVPHRSTHDIPRDEPQPAPSPPPGSRAGTGPVGTGWTQPVAGTDATALRDLSAALRLRV